MEAEHFKTGYDLTKFCIGELAGNRRSNDSVYFIIAVSRITLALFEDIDSIDHERFIGDRAERTLINARAALNALAVIDHRRFFVIHRDSFDFTSVLTGTFAADDSGKRADF